ncbi:MAG: single-stranded DNA-binding protein [Lachnospiraceae bacterium]|nr:single-stranded DNA-binding protein [Lachnospiraceae bacterium]
MNKVILCGRLTRDPEVRYSQGERQMAIARYTLAVDRRNARRSGTQQNEQTADFIQCVAFDRAAEFAEKYLRQGTKMLVTGRIQTGSYTNRDGQRVYTTEVIIEDQEFAESKNGSNAAPQSASGSNSGFAGSFRESESAAPVPAPLQDAGDGFMNIPDGVDDEGLPFQ